MCSTGSRFLTMAPVIEVPSRAGGVAPLPARGTERRIRTPLPPGSEEPANGGAVGDDRFWRDWVFYGQSIWRTGFSGNRAFQALSNADRSPPIRALTAYSSSIAEFAADLAVYPSFLSCPTRRLALSALL